MGRRLALLDLALSEMSLGRSDLSAAELARLHHDGSRQHVGNIVVLSDVRETEKECSRIVKLARLATMKWAGRKSTDEGVRQLLRMMHENGDFDRRP